MTILVTGATGTVGRHLVEQLVQAGEQVRALTRNSARAKFTAEVDVIQGDLTSPASLAAALEGVTGLHLITFGGDDYAPLQTGSEIATLAQQAGVQRVTVLRGSGENGTVETALEASTLDWAFLNPVEFMSGVLDWAESIREQQMVRMGFVQRKSAIVHEADIASVAAAALTQPGHGGKTYSITGGEVLTPVQMVQIIGELTGQHIRLIELSEAEAREQWRGQDFPDEVIDFFVWAHGSTPPEGYTVVPTVEQVTGRPPRTFAQWVMENAHYFRA
ncbi:MAG: NAD(P)H-binding protein [bacterium]|nr:NAD(P)H-binding protein [bacterium]